MEATAPMMPLSYDAARWTAKALGRLASALFPPQEPSYHYLRRRMAVLTSTGGHHLTQAGRPTNEQVWGKPR